MSDILVGSKITDALREIEKQIPVGLNTAENKNVSEQSREVIRATYDTLKHVMELVGSELSISKYNLHLKMGRFMMHGRWKPHIWGAFIPSNVKAPSKITPQLYAFRSSKILGWGICPSDKAMENVLFMKVYKKVLMENRSEVEMLFKKGFVNYNYDSNQTGGTVDAFLNSNNLTLTRVFFTADLPKESEVEAMMAEDMKALLPLYNKIVETMALENLLGATDKDDTEEDEIEASKSDTIRQPQSTGRRFWKISSGRGGKYVNAHKSAGVISIGWGTRSDDVRKHKSYESLLGTIKKFIDLDFDPGHAARQCWLFANDIKKNDYIFAYGSETVLMVGIDKGIYDFKKVNTWAGNNSVVSETHQHIRQVEWLSSSPVETSQLSPDLKKKLGRNQTIIQLTEAEANEILELAGIGEDIFDERLDEVNALSLTDLCKQTSKTPEFFETLKRRLEEKKQIVFFGPPGTSKTHAAKLFAGWFNNGDGFVTSVQFHPSYCYEDFIEGFRPASDNSGRQFALESGVFKEFCKLAMRNRNQKHVFIIDEINRGNLPQIFGELLYLLEYRDEEATLPYSKSTFSIPDNVYIVATMNSADRSIAMVDYALRRRFEFFDFPPDSIVLKNYLQKNGTKIDGERIVSLFDKLNSVVEQELGKHYKIGHTYFMKPNLDEKSLKEMWQYSIMPLLEEYFFDNSQALELLKFESLWGYKVEAA